MTFTLRRIDAEPFKSRLGTLPPIAGAKPQLRWIGVDLLRVDPVYQRMIMERGARNVVRIAQEFNWLKFAPVIVAETDKGIYLVIDGQHRATAAALRGIKDVPCAIVKADRAQQAAAFAAINAQVTAITPMQMHAAKVASGDVAAKELDALCAASGVTICRYPIPANKMGVGETLAAGVLARLLASFGRDVLVSALTCITKTGNGNAGMVRAPVVTALCRVLDAEPDWRKNNRRLLAAMSQFEYEAAYTEAGKASYAERCSITSKLVDAIGDHLEGALAGKAA